MSEGREKVIADILEEREKQVALFSMETDLGHSPAEWVTLLARYLGRFSDRALEEDAEGQYRYAKKIAAVAVAAMEAKSMPPAQGDAHADWRGQDCEDS